MQTMTETNDFNIDYAKIEVRAAREALAAAKNKAMLVALAVSIGVLKSKSNNAAKTIRVEPLREAITDAINTAERRAAAKVIETSAQRDARLGVITQAMADEIDGRHRAPDSGASFVTSPLIAGSAFSAIASRPCARKRARLTNQQRIRKLARNRRRHKRALARARYGWANGQRRVRESSQVVS